METKNKIKINLPTKITIARIALAFALIIAVIVLFFLDYEGVINISNCSFLIGKSIDGCDVTMNYVLLIILGVFAIASFTDFLDGYIARKYNMVTDLGKFLDPIADKMLINGMMIFLCVGFASLAKMPCLSSIHYEMRLFPFFCVILMEIRDLIVDGLRFMAAKKNIVIAANIFGKMKTVLQMVAIFVVLLNGFPFSYLDCSFPEYLKISDILCYAATIVSILSGVIYVKDNFLKVFKEDGNNN